MSSSSECVICFNSFSQIIPKILTLCGHTICEQCVNRLTETLADCLQRRVKCPTCNKITNIPSDGLPTNYALKSLAEEKCSVDSSKDKELMNQELLNALDALLESSRSMMAEQESIRNHLHKSWNHLTDSLRNIEQECHKTINSVVGGTLTKQERSNLLEVTQEKQDLINNFWSELQELKDKFTYCIQQFTKAFHTEQISGESFPDLASLLPASTSETGALHWSYSPYKQRTLGLAGALLDVAENTIVARHHDPLSNHLLVWLLNHNNATTSSNFDKTDRSLILTGHTGHVTAALISLVRNVVVSCSEDQSVRVWSLENGRCLHKMIAHRDSVWCLALAGHIAVTGSQDRTVRLWNIVSGKSIVCQINAHARGVQCVAFDGVYIASGASDGIIIVSRFENQETRLIHRLQTSNHIHSLMIDSTGGRIICGAGSFIHIWRLESSQLLNKMDCHKNTSVSQLLIHNGMLISGTATTIQIWTLEDGNCLHTTQQPYCASCPIGGILSDGLIASISSKRDINLWNVDTGYSLRSIPVNNCKAIKIFPTFLVARIPDSVSKKCKLIVLDLK